MATNQTKTSKTMRLFMILRRFGREALISVFLLTFFVMPFSHLKAQSIDIPTSRYGVSIGNSKTFTGVRLNWKDQNVQRINGLNVTLWPSENNAGAEYNGISVGAMPKGGRMNGVNFGIVGSAADEVMNGISFGFVGAGAGGQLNGISIGGLASGAGEDISGIAVGGLASGCGRDMAGIAFGGLAVGSGRDVKGLAFGGLGAGSGRSMKGLAMAGLGVGVGEDFTGIALSGLGVGAGQNFTGAGFALIGMGCGNRLTGIGVGGFGVGAPTVKGITLAGFATGGNHITGISLAGGMVKVNEGGQFKGLSVSAFNWNKGNQIGIALGILNYAVELNGLQLGLLNIAKNNPRWLRVLPLLNVHLQ